jgi:murein DD-endopeptidase MepM/ murein hydrolase activator NlpD
MTMPPTDPLTTHPSSARPRRTTRRQLFVATAGVVGAAAAVRALGGGLTGGGGLLDASGNPVLTGAAEAESPAERLGPPPPPTREPTGIEIPPEGKIAFPIDPSAESYVLDNYGDCRGGGSRAHIGVDIISERGAPVYAVVDGVLGRPFLNTGTAGWGWTLVGDDDEIYRYFHLDSLEEGLERGDEVEFGQVIGYVGSTGNFMYDDDGEQVEDLDNIHLHFEYWPESGVTADPLPLLHLPDGISVGPPLKSCLSRS